MRDQVDADGAARSLVLHAVDSQADTVHGDGAFVGQKFGHAGGRQNMQCPALADLRKVGHLANAVHMAGDEVATQAVLRAQRLFQVHGTAGAFAAGQPGGFVERFG